MAKRYLVNDTTVEKLGELLNRAALMSRLRVADPRGSICAHGRYINLGAEFSSFVLGHAGADIPPRHLEF